MTFGRRLKGVLLLDAATYEEIESNRSAGVQAFVVVAAASLAFGIGAGLPYGPLVLVRETMAALIGWVMWAGVTYVIGTRLLPEPQTRTDMGELLRVIGFAYAPNLFAVLGVVPIAGTAIRTITAFWILATTIVAVRQALDYRSTLRATGVVLMGWFFFVLITWAF